MTSIYSGLKYKSLMSNRKIHDKKNSRRVLQSSFADLAAEEARIIIHRRDQERHGNIYQEGEARPAEGAFEIVSETNVTAMLDVLVQNGLVRFENNTPVDFSVKDVPEMEKDYIEEVPTSSEILFQMPKRKGGRAEVLFRVLLVDPRFVDENGNPLHKDIPKGYVKAVLNTLNPFTLFLAYGKEVPELVKRAGDQAQGFEQLIKYVAKQWKDKEAPEDFETLREFVTVGMLHEFTHALALHLPDKIPENASAETRRDMEAINFDKYLELINSDQKLQTSVVFNKNLFKALREVRDEEPGVETVNKINAMLALEMFCDRFSIFLYENYSKIQTYIKHFKKAGFPFSVDIDFLLRLETQRRTGCLRQMRGLDGNLRNAEFDALEADLSAAEEVHLYIAKYGDPKLTTAEVDFFSRFLYFVKYLDGEETIMRFTMEHADNSRFIHASVDRLTQEKDIGVSKIIKISEDVGEMAPTIWQSATHKTPEYTKTIIPQQTGAKY